MREYMIVIFSGILWSPDFIHSPIWSAPICGVSSCRRLWGLCPTLCCPTPFWEQPSDDRAQGWQSFRHSQSRERGLAYQEERTNPFPVNFLASPAHMFSNLGSHLFATFESSRSVTACMLSVQPTELPIYACVGSLLLIVPRRQCWFALAGWANTGPWPCEFHKQKPWLFLLSSPALIPIRHFLKVFCAVTLN